MSYTEAKEKYEKLLAKYGIDGIIEFVTGSENPVQDIKEVDGTFTIYLNADKIDEKELEEYAGYNVQQVLLPRLVLETERLTLRRVRREDADAFFEEFSDVYSCAMDDGSEPYSEMSDEFYDIIDMLVRRETQYTIVLKKTGEVVGSVRLWEEDGRAVDAMELGYWINPSHRRRGYAYEATSALVQLVQEELHLELLLAGAIKENEPSIALLKKLGFEREGIMRKGFWSAKNGPMDMERFYRDRI